jgi:sulfite reductase alpha subunit-like flavoprotein
MTAYEDWKFDKCPNMCEVFDEFPSLKVPASLLLSQLPLLQSRYYSISSSYGFVNGEIHCTVAVVSFRTRSGNGPLHHGVCSSWLNRISSSAVIPCFVRRAPSFYLPEDRTAPVIMVGPGTGIAPFRSFWQHQKLARELQSVATHKTNATSDESQHNAIEDNDTGKQWDMSLFFGCRHPSLDHIYKDEVMKLVQEGIISRSFCAYSRDPNQPKQYVQDQLKQEANYVIQKLLRESGHLYVCGDVSMAADVTKTVEGVFREQAGMSEDEARSFVEKMRVTLCIPQLKCTCSLANMRC